MSDKIVVEGLYKVFGDHPERALELLRDGADKDAIYQRAGLTVGVQDAGFSIRAGEVFVVMGLSGSGKSTLVRMLNRLIEPTAGRVLIDGADITAMGRRELIALRRRDMAMVFQSFALLPHLSVLDNVAFGLEVAGVGRHERRERAARALSQVGLESYAQGLPGQLSGGMQQRVGLARALAADPEIMLMDEAFSALDPLIRAGMQDELLRLQRERPRTVVFISHDLDEAMRIGDRIAIMEDGRVMQVGTPREILDRPATDYVRAFFRGVDVSHIYTAADIAADTLPVLEADAGVPAADAVEGGLAVVCDRAGRYRGLLDTAAAAAPALASAEPVDATATVQSMLRRIAASDHPVPVTDHDGRYQGVVTKTALLQTLDKQR